MAKNNEWEDVTDLYAQSIDDGWEDITEEELSDDKLFAPGKLVEAPQVEQVPEEQSFLADIGDTIKDVAIGAGKGTGLGGFVAGIGSALMPDPTADIDEQLRAQGFQLPEDPTLLEKYYEGRAGFEREAELASERSPWLSGAAQLAGGVGAATGAGVAAGAAGLGKLAGAKQALETYNKLKDAGRLGKFAAMTASGAAANAAYTALDGKARTLQGISDVATEGNFDELINTADEIMKSSIIGGVFGGGLSVAGGAGRMLGETNFGKSFKEGLKGINLSDDIQKFSNKLNNFSKGFIKKVNNEQDVLGAEMNDIVAKSNKQIDIIDFFDRAKEKLDAIDAVSPLQKKDKKKLMKYIDFYMDQDNYRNVEPAKVEQIARDFKKFASDFQGKSSIKSQNMKEFALDTSENIAEYVKQEVPGLAKVYDQYSKVKDIQALGKFKKQYDRQLKKKQSENLTKVFSGAKESTDSAFEKQRTIDEMLDRYQELFGEEATLKVAKDLSEKQTILELAKIANTKVTHSTVTNAPNLISQMAGGTYAGILKGSNWMGRVAKTASEQPQNLMTVAKLFRDKANISPKNQQLLSSFADKIDEIVALPPETRSTKMFALIQQPAFRESAKGVADFANQIVGDGDLFDNYEAVQARRWKDIVDKNQELRNKANSSKKQVEQEIQSQIQYDKQQEDSVRMNQSSIQRGPSSIQSSPIEDTSNYMMSSDSFMPGSEHEIMNNFHRLKKAEGDGDKTGAAITAKYGVTQKAIDAIKKRYPKVLGKQYNIQNLKKLKKTNPNEYDRISKVISKKYLEYLRQEMDESIKSNYPPIVQEVFLDTAYNTEKFLTSNTMKQFKNAIPKNRSLTFSDYEDKLKNYLDWTVISKKGKKYNSRGVAKRRAENYNEIVSDQGGTNFITSINQLENGKIQYNFTDGTTYQIKNTEPRSSDSKVGKLAVPK